MRRINKKIKSLWGISEVGFSVMSTADAISAVVAGIVIDKVSFKVGKYRQWLLYCPPVVTVFFIFCFTKIGGDVMAGVIIGVGYVLSHFIWNIAWTANRNLIPVLTDDPGERAFLSGRIAVGSSLGKIIASYLVPFLGTAFLAVFSGVTAYTVIAVIACVLYMICYFIHYGITAGYDTEVYAGKKAVTFKDMAKGIASNPHLIAILLHDAIRLVAYYGIAAATSYYAKVVLEDSAVASWLLIMFYAGNVVGSNFSTTFSKRIGARKTSAFGCIGCAVFMALCYILPAQTAVIAVCMFLAQLIFGVAYGLTANLYAMCGTYSVWKTGEDTRGVVMAFCSLAIKLGVAIRGVLITALLTWIAYDPNAAVITPEAQGSIKFMFAIVFSIIMLVSLIPLLGFRLDEQRVAEMEQEIAKRAQN